VRRRLGRGPFIVAVAVVGAIVGALPYLGLGPDTSPGAPTYLERRYGNIGVGLAMMWFGVMAVSLVIGLALTIGERVRRKQRQRNLGS
jgi:hypothetical protein